MLTELSLFSVIYSPGTGSRFQATLTHPLAILSLGFYLLYRYIQYHEVRDHQPDQFNPMAPREWQMSTVIWMPCWPHCM